MRGYLTFFTVFTVIVVLVCAFVPADIAEAFERDAYVSVGLASEARFPDIGFLTEEPSVDFENDDAEPAEGLIDEIKEEIIRAEQGDAAPLLAQGETESLFVRGGEFTSDLTLDDPIAFETELARRTGLDLPTEYKAFASTDKMTPLESPLDVRELSYLFARIVEATSASLPTRCTLLEISYTVGANRLVTEGRINIRFDTIAKKYNLFWLPAAATFRISLPFSVKNSELSVISDEIKLSSTALRLSEKLVLFGCNLVFGRRDYVGLFSGAVKNVFVNAGIYK